MTWRAAQRAVVAVGATLLLGIGVAGCSDDYQYAATIDGDGHVIVTWCSGAVPVIQVTPAGGLLDHKATNTSPHRVDLADSGAEWSVTGDITITDDSTITLWSEHSAPRPSRSTVSR